MIPISRAPKRFVAALNHTRLGRTSRYLESSRNCVDINRPPYQQLTSSVSYSSRSKVIDAQHQFEKFHNGIVTKPQTPESLQINEIHARDLNGPRPDSWWTGLKPEISTYVQGQPHSAPLLSLASGECTRETLQAYFDNSWTLTESLFASLQGKQLSMHVIYSTTFQTHLTLFETFSSFYICHVFVVPQVKKPLWSLPCTTCATHSSSTMDTPQRCTSINSVWQGCSKIQLTLTLKSYSRLESTK